MLTILQLIAILSIGYLSTHFLIGRLQSRFFFTSGIEYIVLGVLIGPHVTQVMTPEVVSQLSPFISLSIGSLGLLYGLQLRFRDLGKVDAESYRLTFITFLTTFLLVSGLFVLLFGYVLSGAGEWIPVFSAALVLGTTGAISAPTAIRFVTQRYKATGHVTEMIQFAVRLDQLLGILFFGLIFCFLHIGQTRGIRPLTTTEWFAVNLGFGIVLGILFYLFLGREKNPQKLMLGLLGIVVFSSGAAYYLNLSPMFINLVLGIMLANTSKIHQELIEILGSVEKPFYVLVLMFAGASWDLSAVANAWPRFLALVTLYILLRYLGKSTGGRLAYLNSETPELLVRRIGLGLLSQGGVAIAMIVNYQQVYKNEFTSFAVSAVLISMILYEFLSPRWTKRVLIDANEIKMS